MYQLSALPEYEQREILERMLRAGPALRFLSPPSLRRRLLNENDENDDRAVGDSTPAAERPRSSTQFSSPESPFWMESPSGNRGRSVRLKGRVSREEIHAALTRPGSFT